MKTLREVAIEAGVHVSTASAVLNNAGGNTRVSVNTRRRVMAAAKKLAYVPNEAARRLRTGRSNMVGFLGGDLRNPFFAELTAALEDELRQLGLQLVVSHVVHAESLEVESTIGSLRQQSARSIILWEESSTALLKPSREPILSIGFTTRERPGVWLDLEHAIQGAVDEMIRLGFKKLGFFLPRSQRESPSVAIRSAAFLSSCKKRKLIPPALVFYEGESWDLEASVCEAGRMLKDHSGVEAWIGFNDIAGLGLLRRLPEKCKTRVLCFDGTVLARCWPGKPICLDLNIPEFAQTVASVISGKDSANILGQRRNWFRPCLAVEREK